MSMKLLNTISIILEEQTTNVPLVFVAKKWFPGNRYGEFRQRYNGGKGGYHNSNDIAMGVGTPVYAPHSGYVTVNKNTSDCGYLLDIGKKTDNYFSRFCHLTGFAVTNGQLVNAGDLVGFSGGGKESAGKGNSMGAHLHWNFKVKGKDTDPYDGYLSPERLP